MGLVAGEAGKFSVALAEASALAQIQGLMAHVPGIIPVNRPRAGGGRPMAFPAKLVDSSCRHSLRIPNQLPIAAPYMLTSRAMTRFAVNARLQRTNYRS